MYICVCKAVTDSQILTAIENGVCTRKQLIHCFGVGKDCGKCNKEVNDLLKRGTELPVATNHPILQQLDKRYSHERRRNSH